MATTTNYSWTTPDDTALVKDGAAAIRSLGTAIDTTTYNNSLLPIVKTIVDAKGDIIAATAADTVSRLAVGANDTVLTADSTAATGLKWATPAAGGMTLISTTTLTGASITLSSIPATYNNLQLVIRNFRPATDATQLRIRYNADSATRYRWSNSINADNLSFNSTSITISPESDNGASSGFGVVTVYDYANTATYKMSISDMVTHEWADPTLLRYQRFFGLYNQTGAISSIELAPLSGNFTSGTVLLYGVK